MSGITSIARLERVRVTFDGYFTFALADVSLDVRRGEVLGVIGPKGSGKSTLLNLLAGKLKPSEGKARVFGRSPRRGGVKTRIGHLPRANQPSSTTGMRAFLNRLTGARRESANGLPIPVQVERLLLKHPELLLLDEPFAGLDAAAAAELSEMIRKFAGQGKTIVLTASTLETVMEICDRLAIFFRGQIQAAGAREELLALPDALRIFGPVLPGDVAQRMRDGLRSELLPRLGAILQPTPNPPPIETPATGHAAPDTVDHDKLNRLIKPSE